MFSIFSFVKILFYYFVFYEYIFIDVRRVFHFKNRLISKLIQRSDMKYGLGTAIAKA